MRTRRARSRKTSRYANVIEHLESRYLLSGAGDLVGDTPATAEDLGVLTAAQPFFLFGTIDEAFDLDVFQFQAGGQETATIELSADFSSLDTFVRLLDSSGNELAFDDDSGPGTNSLLRFTVNSGETYFVEAGDFSSGTGDFTLELSLDVGDTIATATDLGTVTAAQPLNFFGTIEQASDHDFFQFQTALSGTATIDLGADFSSIDTVVTLFDSSGTQLANNDDFGGSTDSHLTFALDGGETYFVRARGFSSSTGDYELNVSIATDVVGDTIAAATDLGLLNVTEPLSVNGIIDQASDRDVFQFQASTTGDTVVELSRGSGSLDTFVSVLDSSGNVIASDDDGGPGTDSLLTFAANAGETYFVETRGFSTSTGEFTLTISVEAGDTLGTATDLGVLSAAQPIQIFGAIEVAFDLDVFQFQVNASGLTLVELNALNPDFSFLDTIVTVFDSSGNVIATNDDIPDLDVFSLDSVLTFLVEGGESYFVEASELDDFTGDYRLSLTLAPDLGLLTLAQPLEVFDVVESEFDRDVFQFEVATTGTVLVELGADSSVLDSFVTVLNSAGEEIASNDDINPGVIRDSRLAFAAEAGETYFVQARGFDDSIGEYRLNLTLRPDVGDTIATAEDLGVVMAGRPLEVDSVVTPAFDRDVFQIQADATASVVVELNRGSGFLDAFVSVLDSLGNVVAFDDDSGEGLDSRLTFAAEQGQNYFVEARGFGSSVGEYILRITLDVGFPIASATDLGNLTDVLPASGTIEASETHDLFLFTATADGFVEIREVASADDFFALDGVLQAFDIDSRFPIATDFGSFDTTVPRVVIIPVVAGESYFAEVTGYFGSVGDYDLSISMLAEIGDTIATAEDIGQLTVATPLDFSSRIDSTPDVDVFQFQAATSGSVLVELGADGFSLLDTVVRVLDSNGQQIAFNDDIDFASFDTDSRVSFQAEAGESYFVEASGFLDSTGDYLLHIEFDVGFPPETATDLGDLTPGQPSMATGTIEAEEFHDLFLFTATTTGTVRVQQTASASDSFALDGVLQAFNVDSSVPIASDFGTFDTTVPRVVSFTVVAGESYFAEVTGFSGSLGDYLLNINYVVDDVPPAGVDFEFPSQRGSIEVSGDTDTYRLTATANQTLQFSLDAVAGSFLDPVVEVRVFAPNDLTTPVSTFRNDDFGFSFNSFLTVPVLQGQVIEVVARGFSSSRGDYLLTIATFNGAAGATDLVADTPAFGGIETSFATDVFRFTATSEGMATIDVTSFDSPTLPLGEIIDPIVTIRESDTGNFVAFDDDSGLGLNSLVTFTVTPGTSYDVVVGGFGTRAGNYQVTLSLNASDDFGDTFDQATALSFAGNPTIERDGRISQRTGNVPADVDVFSFTADSNETLRLLVTPSDGFDAGLSVFQASPSGSTADVELLAVAVPPESGEDTGLRELFVPVTEGRTYFFRVSGLDGSFGDYSLLVERRTDLVASEAPGADLLFTDDTGTPANPAGQSIDFPTDRDWYRLEATAIGEFTINLAQAPGGNLDPILTIYNDEGLAIARNDDSLGLNSQFTLQARRVNEVFFVEAAGINGTTGDYELTVQFAAQEADDIGNDPGFGHFTVIPEGSPGRFTQQASLEVEDDRDFFAFTAAVGGSFTVELVTRDGSPLPEGVEVQVFEVEAASLTAISLDSLTQVALITSEGGELALNLPEGGEGNNGIEVQRSPDDLLRTERHFLVAVSNVGTDVAPLDYTLNINVTSGVASQNLQLLNAALFALLSLADGAAALGDQNPEAINAAIQAALNELGKSGNFLVVLLDPVNDPVLTDSSQRATGFTSNTGTLNGIPGGYASVGSFGQVLIVPVNLGEPGSLSLQFSGVGSLNQAMNSFSAFTVGQSGSAPVSLAGADLTPSESGKSNFVVQLGFGDTTVIPTPGSASGGQVPSFFMMTNVMSKDRQTPADTTTQPAISDSAIVRVDDRQDERASDSSDPFELAFWRDVLDGVLQELQIEGLSRPTLDHVLQRLRENDSKLPADLLKNSSVGRSAKAMFEVLKNSTGWLRNAKPMTPAPKPRPTVPKTTQKSPAPQNAPQAASVSSTKSVPQLRG